MFCPEKLIEEAVELSHERSIALFCLMKGNLSHGWFYSKHDAAKTLGISPSTFYRLIAPLEEMGLVFHDGKNYKLKTRTKLEKEYGKHCSTVLIKKNDNLTQIKKSVLAKLIEKWARQQRVHIKDYQLNDFTKGGCKAAISRITDKGAISFDDAKRKRINKIKYEELLTSAGFTYKWLAEQLNCSHVTAREIMKRHESRGNCNTKVLRKRIKKMSAVEYNKEKHLLRKQYPSLSYNGGYAVYTVCTLFYQRDYWAQDTNWMQAEPVGRTNSLRSFASSSSWNKV